MNDRPEVFETLGWNGHAPLRAERHLARAGRACATLGYPFDRAAARAALAGITAREPRRLRLSFAPDGTVRLVEAALPPTAADWRIRLSAHRVEADDPWLQIKTTRRDLYDATRAALPTGVDEVIFANTRGEVTEGTITTLFFDAGNGLCTPPLNCGLLPGILREELLESGAVREEGLPAEALTTVRLWCGNALRGLIPARLVP